MKLLVLAAVVGGACAPSSGAPITVEPPTDGFVDGSTFHCTGSWPSSMTPCAYPWSSSPITDATDAGDGIVRLTLHRTPIPVDGGASDVYLELQYGSGQDLSASAWEETTRAGDVARVETSDPTDGWIEPLDTGRSAQLRNAGHFGLTFEWGSIVGTYDTSPPQP